MQQLFEIFLMGVKMGLVKYSSGFDNGRFCWTETHIFGLFAFQKGHYTRKRFAQNKEKNRMLVQALDCSELR